MRPFTRWDGLVVPIDRSNVDTDAILPKQFLKSTKRTGFGPHLFDELRYRDAGELGQDPATRSPDPGFVLNQQRYQGCSVLLARANFGCGSSREHAPWALQEFGIRALVAPSFADIFLDNCLANGLLPVTLPAEVVDGLFQEVLATPGYRLAVDLVAQTATTPSGTLHRFAIEPLQRERLLHGLDEIALTFRHTEAIRAHERALLASHPWLFD